jgi:hypothetical protein
MILTLNIRIQIKRLLQTCHLVCPFQGIISNSKSVSFQIPSSDKCLTHAWHIHVGTVCNEMEVGIMIEFWINEGHNVREMQNCNLVV